MSREERKLRKHLEEHFKYERRKMQKQTSGPARGEDPQPPRARLGVRTADWEEFEERELAPAVETRPRRRSGAPLAEGLVIGIGPGTAKVLRAGEAIDCRSAPGLAVGDRVFLGRSGRRIEEILPRKSVLARPDPHNRRVERVIAANIDAVVVVASVREPALKPGLIDRYLVAIERGGAEPLVCINKIDLCDSDAVPAEVAPYQELGLRVMLCSARTGQGVAELLDAMAGKLCVLAGHSGVGKSSLLNAIDPDLALATAAVSDVTEKGRHTTSSSRLYQLANGARIIDTPGVREFGLWKIEAEELRGYFHEFDRWAPDCGFADCAHLQEPSCAVRAAAAAGRMPAARYASYLRVLGTLD